MDGRTAGRRPAQPFPEQDRPVGSGLQSWFSLGVFGIGGANFLSDLGQEIPTVLLPAILNSLGAPAAALGLIESVANGALGIAKFVGGPVADTFASRRPLAVVSYVLSALFSGLIGLAATPFQVGGARVMAIASKGLQVPARNALLAELIDPAAYGRAYGLKRLFDSLGGILGLSLVVALMSRLHLRDALLISAIPGLLAAVVVLFTVPQKTAAPRDVRRPDIRPLLQGRMGRVFLTIILTQVSLAAATLPILRATQVLVPILGSQGGVRSAMTLYIAYKVASGAISIPAGFVIDRWGAKPVMVIGAALLSLANLAYLSPGLIGLGVGFLTAGLGIGCLETAQCAAVAVAAPSNLRGSAFGVLAALQNLGTVFASVVAGALWTLWSPAVAFAYLSLGMLVGAVAVVLAPRFRRGVGAP